jgi:cytochrome c oxidase subunit 4
MSAATEPALAKPKPEDEEGHSHAVPLRVLAAVWGALVILTWITISATRMDLGAFNIVIALTIAVVKSAYVVLYFMHLRYDRPFNAVILISAIAFVALFIGFLLMDTKGYQPDVIPGYAPEIEASRSAASH